MKIAYLQEVRDSELLKKRLAKMMALECVRDTKLEKFHAGQVPRSKTGDYSDVKVISPFGEVPWTSLSRLNDDEMRLLMIDVVNHCYRFLTDLFDERVGGHVVEVLKRHDPAPKWCDPK